MSHFLRLPGVPERARVFLKQLLTEDLIPVDAMAAIVESYRRVIHESYKRDGKANFKVGDAIADAALDLLDSVNELITEKELRVIQAGVRYFVIQDDGQGHDLATEHGLNDDAHVMNAVLRFFGRDELMIRDLPEARTQRVAAPRPDARKGLMRRLRR